MDNEKKALIIDIPTWQECDDRRSQLEDSHRTIDQIVMNGSALTPLEAIVHAYDDSDPERSKVFISDVKKLVEWCLNNPDYVLAKHEQA